MTEPQQHFLEAVAFHRTGDLTAAEPLYQSVLKAVPHHLDAMYLLGTLQLQQGQFEAAVERLTQVCSVQPEVAAAHNNLGIAYKALGRLDEAVHCFERAIAREKNYVEAYFNLGQIRQAQQRMPEAVACYRRVRELDPADLQVLQSLAEVLLDQQEWPEAEQCYREILKFAPQQNETRVRLGFVLTQQEKLDEAARTYEDVLRTQPDYTQMQNNLSFIYERQGRLDEAAQAARRAIELRPDYAEAYNNLGIALRSLHQLQEACGAFEQALQLQAEFPMAKFNLAATRMLAGDLAGGWDGFESREALMLHPPRPRLQPRWQGEPLTGKTLLVHADEGLGDTLQFVRFLPQAKSVSGARITLACQSGLSGFLQGIDGTDDVHEERNLLASCDAHIPLLSLPGLLGTTWDSLPNQVPYVRADPTLGEKFQDIVDADSLSIGLVWQGNPVQPRDVLRSCPLNVFEPLLKISGTQFISLQVGAAGLSQLSNSPLREKVVDVSDRLTDFAETAALIVNLDLVITVDTSVAHLAGARGAKVWTLLSHTPDWRWLLDREDSPWYPTMRLFRQPAWGDWVAVISQVAAQLPAVVSERKR